MTGTVWSVRFAADDVMFSPVSYWIATPRVEVAIARARRKFVADRKREGYMVSQTRQYRLVKVELAGTVDA